jgi:Domain of unknown function (DUF6458)
MGVGVGLILIAVGAILTWGVTDRSNAVNLDVVGVILMVVGAIGVLLSLAFWSSFWGPGYMRRGYAADGPAPRRRYVRRRPSVVEEEIVEEGP